MARKKWDDPVHYYWNLIRKGKVTVSRKVYLVYEEQIRIIEKSKKYEYDPELANRALIFIERYCKQSKGKKAGKPLELEPWERALIACTFGIVDKKTRLRKYRQVMLIVGRKNGKSTLASAVGLYLMIADGEAGSEVYAAATKKDQAKIIWTEAKKMVGKSPALRKRIKRLVAEMTAGFNESTFKPLGADSDTLDGLNVHGALLDEIHAWKTKDLYDVIVDGEASREQPLTFITSTAGTVRESIFDILYAQAENLINGFKDPEGYRDDTFLPIIYELDNRSEWVDEACWAKANPGLGTIKNKSTLKEKVEKAKSNELLVKNLLCKDFNIRETTTESWLTFEELNNEERFEIEDLKPRYGIGGVDLSATTDLTAAKMIFRVPEDPRIYVISKYWIPEDLIEKRVKEDHIPYDIWVERGYIDAIPGKKIHPKYITEWFVHVRDELDIYPYYIGYDSWAAEYWVEDMANNFGKEVMVPVIQGKKTLSVPMYELKAEFQDHHIVYNNNPVDKWCLSNTAVDIDRNGNIQPHKGKSRLKRIDGAAALLDCYTVYHNKEAEYLSVI